MSKQPLKPVQIDVVRSLVEDLREARAAMYFCDLLLSALTGWALFVVAMIDGNVGVRVLAFLTSGLLLYRAVAFIHELFHQQAMKGFRILWHALVGVPLMIPFLLYLPVHQNHHNSRTYGTRDDGEYEQFFGRSNLMSIRLFVLNFVLPLALIVRFGVLTPLSAVLPTVRRDVIPNFVHMALRMPYRAPEINERMRRESYVMEAFCATVAWCLLVLCVTGHWRVWLWWFAIVFLISTLNTVRAICSTHLYVEQTEGRGAGGQLLDSLNINNDGLFTQLMCPVGLRFHALHHIAPYLPYHVLSQAHRRLIDCLPAESDYHQVSVPSLWKGWQRVLAATSSTSARPLTGKCK